MVKQVDYRSTIETSQKVLVRLGMLPYITGPGGVLIPVSNTPREYTLTNGTPGLAATAEEITLSTASAGDEIELEAGELLYFPGATPTDPLIEVQVGRRTTVTNAGVVVPTLPIPSAIADAAETTTYGLKIIEGLTEGNPDPALSETDISDYQAGKGTVYGVYQFAPTISVVANVIYESPAHSLLEYMTWNSDFIGLNMYVDITYQLSGRRIYGVGIVTTSAISTPVHDRLTINATIAFQGEPVYEAPTLSRAAIQTMRDLASAEGTRLRAPAA